MKGDYYPKRTETGREKLSLQARLLIWTGSLIQLK